MDGKRYTLSVAYTGVFMEVKGYALSWRTQEFSWKGNSKNSQGVDRSFHGWERVHTLLAYTEVFMDGKR